MAFEITARFPGNKNEAAADPKTYFRSSYIVMSTCSKESTFAASLARVVSVHVRHELACTDWYYRGELLRQISTHIIASHYNIRPCACPQTNSAQLSVNGTLNGSMLGRK